jgi:periplasmic copper chaperone A
MHCFVRIALGCLIALLFSGMAVAHEFSVGSLTIDHPWSRATPSSAKVGGAYFTISNNGTEPDVLVSAMTNASERAEFHLMAMTGDVMTMAKVTDPLVIMPGQKLVFEPGGLHMMLFDLKTGLKEGRSFEGRLRFEKAGSVDVVFNIDSMGAKVPSANSAGNTANDAQGHNKMKHGNN